MSIDESEAATDDTRAAPRPLADGRRDADQRRYQRVLATITGAAGGRGQDSVSATARAAGVHRSYLYRHPDLLDLIHQAAAAPPAAAGDEQVSAASLRADLAHARDRARRAEATIRQLESQLSRALGHQVWAETGLGADEPLARAQRELDALKQKLADSHSALEERTEELAAARDTNRELMAQLNTRHRG